MKISLNVSQSFEIFSIENSVFKSEPHFFNWTIFGVSNFLSFLCSLEISPVSDVGLVKIFSHSVGCQFVFLMVFSVA